jgi:hypothetical protein
MLQSISALNLAFSILALPGGVEPCVAGEVTAMRLEVTPAGAFYRTVPGGTRTPPGGPAPMSPAGPIWSHPDGGLLWIGNAVSIGNHGTEVFTEYDLNNESAELFSALDVNPPTAIWSDPTAFNTEDHHVASAESTNTVISIRTVNAGQPTASVVLGKYTSLSPVPDWTYGFDFGPNGGGHCAISRDGQTIVAGVYEPIGGTADIAVFSPASNIPVSYTPIAIGTNNGIRGFDLSADGSTLYFATAGTPTAHIFDIATQTVVFSQPLQASFDSHAISGNGSVFAFGNFGSMSVYEKSGPTYTNTYNQIVAGQCYCAMIDISDDSSTIASGYTFYNNYLTVHIKAVDVPTKQVTMTDVVTTTGSLQNIVSAISISADGKRFAAGIWGDGPGPVAEMRFYARDQNAPIGTLALPGSVFGLQISADGHRMVAGSKAVHANDLGNGGFIDLWGEATPFTSFCPGDGSLATACPCANSGMTGHGCENSSGTGGALLTANGTTSPDTIVLTSSSEKPTALTVFAQGSASSATGILYGDGIRCYAGAVKRLGSHNAVGGTASFPSGGDPSITARSAALGDPLSPGVVRYYQAYYRDPVSAFCPSQTFNVANGVTIIW